MSGTNSTYRRVVEDVLGRDMTKEVWTGNYSKVLPISLQPFELSAVLPAVFYMFRFGQRRGRGKFAETFGGEGDKTRVRRKISTIENVAERLVKNNYIEGFEDGIGSAIMGDLLLSFCLENAKRQLGRKEPVQRVAPAHYMASWIDLPSQVSDLRFVPEMIVAMLANQQTDWVGQHPESERSFFTVARDFENNVLLKAFHQGIGIQGERASRTSDRFDENSQVGLDQLLMIRLAQELGAAPVKLQKKGSPSTRTDGERISNQRPIAEKAAEEFADDIRRFVRSYADVIPRHSLVDLLESCMAVGLTSVLTSVTEMLLRWAANGEVLQKSEQQPTCLLVDCSNGTDRHLRLLAEQSFDDFTRRLDRLPIILMVLRLLDWGARYNPQLRTTSTKTIPYASEWISILGDILFGRHSESTAILNNLRERAFALADKLRLSEESAQEAASLLEDESGNPNAAWRLAEGLAFLMSKSSLWGNLYGGLDGFLNVNRPNGIAVNRRVHQKNPVTGKGMREVRSVVLTDSVLDYLVHLHVLRPGHKPGFRPLSFKEFVQILRDRYGFYVDASPRGMTISNDLLRINRAILERRLRDLGLLIGVNDAEAMKYLQPRFTQEVAHNAH